MEAFFFMEAEAFFTPDEQQMFFISNRPKEGTGNPETMEIWHVKKERKEWGTPQILGSPFEILKGPLKKEDKAGK